MKTIVITPKIIEYSREYYVNLSAPGIGNYKTPIQRLIGFETALRRLGLNDYANYVKEIIRLYPIIIKLRPFYFELFHQRYFQQWNHLNLSATITIGSTTTSFYKYLVDRMRYEDVRAKHMLPYIKKMGIKTCVYCNAQYAVTIVSKSDTFATYELDHYYPQSLYPYLSTSFFNLVPSCSRCNVIKSNSLVGKYPLYSRTYNSQIKFEISKASLIKYYLSDNSEELEICIKDTRPIVPSFANTYDLDFHINNLYSAHKDEVEELVWKYKVYNKTYKDELQISFKKLFPNCTDYFYRLYLGIYDKESDVLKRPLSKLKQDVAKQLKLKK